MNLYAILSAVVLALIAMGAVALALCSRRPPVCPACGSRHIDRYPCNLICRACGKQWEESRRFGIHTGSDS
jgi:ribosomal protein L37AE/L43A